MVLLGGGAVGATLLTGDDADRPVTAPATIGDDTPDTRDAAPVAEQRSEPIDGSASALVDEVWLLDRGDGTYDWGALVSSTSDVLRRDLAVTVTLLDAAGVDLVVEQVGIAELVPGGHAVVGGVVEIDDVAPRRVEVTATLGTAAPGDTAVRIEVSDVRRIGSGQLDRDDRLLGTVEVLDGDAPAVRIAALWRDEAGRVVASVVESIVLDGEAGDGEFSVRLPRTIVPAGEPDDVIVNAAAPS